MVRQRINHSTYILPIVAIILIFFYLWFSGVCSAETYIEFQKGLFYKVNRVFSQYPQWMYNLTQLGDALILLSFCSLLMMRIPRVWNALTVSMIVSVIFSVLLKSLFSVPRPFVVLNHDSFTVVGEALAGYSSLPSGHTITAFTILMTLFYTLHFRNKIYRLIGFFIAIGFGLLVAVSRTAVGAHYPFDTIVGAMVGCFSAAIGSIIGGRIYLWENLRNRYPFVIILLLLGVIVAMLYNINTESVFIYYLSLISLLVSLKESVSYYILKNNINIRRVFKMSVLPFAFVMSVLTFLCFNYPFFKFTILNLDYTSLNGVILFISLVVAMLFANTLVYYLIFSISRKVGKIILSILFIVSALALYFVNTYGVIIDESMIGNVLNTNYEESSGFFSLKMILYVVLLGVLPSIYIFKVRILRESLKRFLVVTLSLLVFLLIIVFGNAFNWLWIDKYSKQLGGLVMPWSYVVNTSRFYIHKSQENQKEVLLPDATITNDEKAVVVLVIGESARRENFSLYGYSRNTNPLLSTTENVTYYNATSCATYTTAGVKCILEYQNTDTLYEILPNYLYRNGVDVTWLTSNWGEPPVHIKKYISAESLRKDCKSIDCNYDGVLFSSLKERITQSNRPKVLIVIHTSTSHGPLYSKKYPSEFQAFKPVCNSVELGDCSHNELINAYDNTIVYTDYLLHSVITQLKELKDYKTAMIYVSDHGESLGEKNLYMHGLPMSIAPSEQYEIPFIVWSSDLQKPTKKLSQVYQNYVFHSVLNFLDINSPIYQEDKSVFK